MIVNFYATLRQVIDTASGTQIAHIDTEATELAISQDGKRLFLPGGNDLLEWTEILDTGSLEIKQHITGRTIRSLTRLDREALLVSLTNRNGAQSALALFDPETLAQITVWPVWGNAGLLVP